MIPSYRKDSLEENYKKLHELGKGGMGTTYAAEDVNTGKKVALKVISLQNQTDVKSLELLEREVTVLKKLNHPNIPKYIDYFQLEDDNKLYLVQELVAGKNLNQKIEEGLRLTEKEVKNITVQILSILDYLHNFDPRIIHRDIKPHNLILSDDGQIFLVDFGAVHNAYYNTMMGETVGIGTIGYMSPEQQIGKPVPASDLYSLGRTLLYLLTRRPPDNLLPHKATVNLEIIGDYIQLSDEFIEWLEKILDPDVDERFSSAKKALKALKNPKLFKQEKLSKIRWFAWLGLGFACVEIATFSYNHRWKIFNTLSFPTPLEICNKPNIKTIHEYFNSGGKLTKSDAQKCRIFWHTQLREDTKEILKVLINHGADVNAKNEYGETPLHTAVLSENKEIVELLINHGADVNAKNEYDGKTPLYSAVLTKNKEIVELLINHGADVNLQNEKVFTPLDIAGKANNKKIAELLINYGVDVNTRDKSGNTPLYSAVENNNKKRVELLINNGADVNARDKHGFTPLHNAVWKENKEIVELLINNGADVNTRNNYGFTPLNSAIWKENKKIVELLINNAADVNAKDKHELTAFDYAKERGNGVIMNLLRKHGAR
ncbi:ankyrin repeat domain-containing protein [Crocosphaera sp.]|uniref:ankyrin repeat domain-containing protein n=1 Tax=Crocosphaera sp. TaxID=2729996 RepID=UPI002612D974|nr:ankyrin repeat domain-containing protein [Crocosphaera sp.]MDJ0578866.1 ankyrin repeat domain-containing protein [Crocosphaera sp.]